MVKDLPPLDSLKDYHPNLVTKVYSTDKRLIAEFYMERRIVVPISRIPNHLISAFLAAEDMKFFEHEGISYKSIIRAFYKNLTAGRIVQGGSTITQQVARSFFLTSERKLSRKLRELILAYRIEKSLAKDEILELYLNQIYFGNGAYGVQTASESYFGKNVDEIDLAEAAMLAGLPKAPSKYSPYANFELAKNRQEFVLGRMLEEGLITREQSEMALDKKLKLKPKESLQDLWVGPYFTEHVRRYLEEKYGADLLYKGGLKVYTTMDVEAQQAANEAVREGLLAYDKRHGYRGPVTRLKTPEEFDGFREESDKKLSERPLETGRLYQAVITSVNAKNMSLSVEIGGVKGVISQPELEWARLYNPTGSPDSGKPERFDKIFRAGDVVDVSVISLPQSKASIAQMRLEQRPQAEASLVAMEPETGFVKALVGGFDFSKTQFNRAVQAMRQPGSAFKPIIYTAAIDKNYTPATVVMDTPIVFDDAVKDEKWRPRNFDEKFFGPTTVRKAIARSRNIVTIKILKDIGVASAIDYATRLGISAPLANDLSIALGSSAVTLIDLTTAFATIANSGTRPTPMFVTKVVDREGTVLEENHSVSQEAISPQTAFIMTNLLKGVIENGTGGRARALGRPAAGKTGTTNNLNDAWFIGYVPGLTAGAWVGYDDERELGRGETGAHAALPIWLKFMQGALEGTAVRNFTVPEGIEFSKIDPDTGLLASSSTEKPIFEAFKAGTAPQAVTPGNAASEQDFFMLDTGSGAPIQKEPADESEFHD